MALTTQERSNIIKLTVVMFNAAPGATYLADLTTAYETNGRSLAQLAITLAENGAYKALNPVFQTASGFATAFLTPLGLQANQIAIDFVITKFNAGLSKGQIAYDAAVALDGTSSAEFADAKAIMNNKTAVAEYYSVTKAISQTNVGTLQQVLSAVTKDLASVTAAEGAINAGTVGGSGNVFTLTSGAETLTGTQGADTFNSADTTLTAADSVDGAAGIDTLNFTNAAAAALPAASIKNVEIINVRAMANLNSSDLSALAGLTNFNADRATAATITAVNAAAGVQYGLLGDNSSLFGAAEAFGYASGVSAATLNLANGVKSAAATTVTLTGSSVTSTLINSTGVANSLSVAATAGAIVNAATSKATTINAAANLTTALTTTADTLLTVIGTSVVDLRGVNYGSALNNLLVTINASTQTSGGTLVQAGNASDLKFTGGAGNDTLGLGAVVAAGATVDGGGGTDTLYVAGNSTYISAATGAIIKNFEVVDATTATIDLDNLVTNNTLTGLRVGGSVAVSNINAATAGAITVYANATPVLNVKGATSPGQLDIVRIDVNDGSTIVNTITLTAPTLTSVETLQIVATDNVTITSLANALALTGITLSGAGAISLTTASIALNPNVTVDASTATGTFSLDSTGATANGYIVKGSAGANTLKGGAGTDLLGGGQSADTLNGGQGTDILTGAAGADVFSFTATAGAASNGATFGTFDTVTDFVVGTDKLQFAGVTEVVSGQQTAVQASVTALTAGSTAAAIATAMATANTTNLGVSFAVFEGNTYVLYEGSGAGTGVVANDVFIKLASVASGATFAGDLSTTTGGAGSTFTLTTAGDNFAGTEGDDTFNSTYDAAVTDTFSAADVLAGNGGTGDTLNISHIIDVAITPPDTLWTGITGIEKVVMNTTGNGAQTITTGVNFQTAFGTAGVDFSTTTSGAGAITVNMNAFTGAAKVTATSVAGAIIVSGANLTDVTVTTTGAGAQTINSTGASAVTVKATSGDGATTISLAGGNDTISLFASTALGANAITGGAGADTINLVTGGFSAIDTLVQADGASKVSTATTTTAAIAAGQTVTFGNGVDIINGFLGGTDVLDVGTAGAAVTGIGLDKASFTAGTIFLSGAYVAGTGVFTIANNGAGADTLVLDSTVAADRDIATADTWIVLVGTNSASLIASSFI